MQLSMPEAKRPSKLRLLLLLFILLLAAAAGGLIRYYTGRVTFDGHVTGTMSALGPEIAGTVTKVAVHEGEHVAKGRPLIFLADAALQVALAQEQETLARLEALVPPEKLRTLAPADSASPGQNQAVETLEQRLQRERFAEEEAHQNLQAASSAEAKAAVARNRTSILAAEGKINKQKYAEAIDAHEYAKLMLERAKTVFEQHSLTRAATSADLRRTQTAQQQAGVDQISADLRLKAYEAQLAKTRMAATNLYAATLRAPEAGVVAGITVKPGAAVNAGQPAVYFMSTEATPTVVAFVSQKTAAKLHAGQPCMVEIPASQSSPFKGRISAVLPRVPAHADATAPISGDEEMQIRIALLPEEKNVDLTKKTTKIISNATYYQKEEQNEGTLPLLLPEGTAAAVAVYLRAE